MQRQKIALVRNLIKRPDILILNDGLNMLEADQQSHIMAKLKQSTPDLTLLWVSNTTPADIEFDQHMEIKAGKVKLIGSGDSVDHDHTEEVVSSHEDEDMAMEGEIQALQNVPLFANLDSSRLKFLAFTSERKTYQANEVLFRQNDRGNDAYIIMSGSADVILEGDNGEENALFRLGKNQLVGELALLCDTPRTATIRAVTPLIALKLNREIFTELAKQDAHFSFEMTRDMSERLVRTTSELNSLTNAKNNS